MKHALKLALAATAIAAGVMAAPTPAKAQEIQITGPLAGAPAVRKLRQYREGRFEVALGWAPTLLDEYKRTQFVAGRLQYNVFDWLGVGVFGGFGVLNLNTDLTDKIEETPAPRNTRTSVNLPSKVGSPKFENQTAQMSFLINPQVTFSPFRGKLALFQKLFIDTDLYVHGGLAFVGLKERADCGGTKPACDGSPSSFAQQSRVGIAPSFGLGFSLYPSNFIGINLEYRAFPIIGGTNRGGFDSRGNGDFPDQKIDSQDRTFKFNNMVFIAAVLHFPMRAKVSD